MAADEVDFRLCDGFVTFTCGCVLSVPLLAGFWSLSIPLSSMLSICCVICILRYICAPYGKSK